MKKGMLLVLVGAVVVGVFLYSSGYFGGSEESSANSISVVSGWNDITIPSSWPDTTASEFMDENPSITTVSFRSSSSGSGHWVSCNAVIPNVNNFDITPGMELTVLAQGDGMITSPR